MLQKCVSSRMAILLRSHNRNLFCSFNHINTKQIPLYASSRTFVSFKEFNLGFLYKCESKNTTDAKVAEIEASSTTQVISEKSISNTVSEVATNVDKTEVVQIDYIPPPPEVPLAEVDTAILNALGEKCFSYLGLITWNPVGFMLKTLEFIHVTTGLPWWGSIAILTVILRTCLMPVTIFTLKNNNNFSNHAPGYMALQQKMAHARGAGDELGVAKAAYEIEAYSKKHNINTRKMFIGPMIQAPVFLSMFMGLKKCANLPVESMTTGGMSWFTDLTIADPYYALPLFTTATLYCTLKYGTDNPQMSQSAVMQKVILIGMPLIMIPVTANFPTAILCYWCTNNFINLIQCLIIKRPAVAEYFGIPKRIPTPPAEKKSIKSSWAETKKRFKDQRTLREVSDRSRLDEINFRKAGTAETKRTYSFNPKLSKTNVVPGIQAKRRD